ncbi:MAG: FIST signal transduction protein [Gemmatimonadaceae bacterium]
MRTKPSAPHTPLRPPAPAAGRPASALSHAKDTRKAAAQIIDQLSEQLHGASPTVVIAFCSPAHDDAVLAGELRERFPSAQVVGCTTAGEFVERDGSVGGVSAMALPVGTVRAAHLALARFGRGVDAGIQAATAQLSRSVGADLRTLDPKRYVGIVLSEGLRMKEEVAADALGAAAPQLVFVGGSAGDDLGFKETRVFAGTERSNDGAALLLLDMAVPFTFTKTCSFVPTQHRFTVTRADEANRVVYELDGRPALEAYAAAAGTTPASLGGEVFMTHPVGMMLDGDPWIRSPQQALPDGGLKFYCRITEGSEVHLMQSTDLVRETRQAVARAVEELGGRAGGALVFNCILRRLELDAKDAHESFRSAFAGLPTAGFHTYGEIYLGHVNQTATALVFG